MYLLNSTYLSTNQPTNRLTKQPFNQPWSVIITTLSFISFLHAMPFFWLGSRFILSCPVLVVLFIVHPSFIRLSCRFCYLVRFIIVVFCRFSSTHIIGFASFVRFFLVFDSLSSLYYRFQLSFPVFSFFIVRFFHLWSPCYHHLTNAIMYPCVYIIPHPPVFFNTTNVNGNIEKCPWSLFVKGRYENWNWKN